MISIKNLEFSYGREIILNDITLNLHKKEFVSIVGPNGTGKSTLIKCVNKFLQFKNGEIIIKDKNLTDFTLSELAKELSYVPQYNQVLFNLTVFEYVLFGRKPHTKFIENKADKEKVILVLQLLGLEKLAFRNFNELSGGQQQKVAIARALVQETGVILLDEPISNLDLGNQLEVMNILREVVDKLSNTVVTILHDLNIASMYSDRIIVMNQGEIVNSGKVKEVINKELIAEVYGVETEIIDFKGTTYVLPLSVKTKE